MEHLPQNKLEEVVQLVEVLSETAAQPTNDPKECRLLGGVQKRLPESEQVCLNELGDRQEWVELSEAEHQELMHAKCIRRRCAMRGRFLAD